MLLKGVTMINHLKSKILITGRNFCYLKSPLVARKKKKNYHRLFSSKSREGGGMVWGDSAAAQRWGGGQDPTPGRGLVRGRMGPAMVLEESEKDASQRSGSWGGGARARTYCLLPVPDPPARGLAGIPPVGAPEGLLRTWQLVVSPFSDPDDP